MATPTDPAKLEAALQELKAAQEARLQARIDAGEITVVPLTVVVGLESELASAVRKPRRRTWRSYGRPVKNARLYSTSSRSSLASNVLGMTSPTHLRSTASLRIQSSPSPPLTGLPRSWSRQRLSIPLRGRTRHLSISGQRSATPMTMTIPARSAKRGGRSRAGRCSSKIGPAKSSPRRR
jgi:hypothetical protein